jgi:hypothetical protein
MKRFQTTFVATLALSLATFAVDGLAADLKQPSKTSDVTAQHQAPSPARTPRSDSGSEINGRSDWDVDYPSQLAPQLLQASAPSMATDSTPRPVASR